MKNLRKVLAFTLALAMLLSTMTFTTFAASKEVEALANLKLLLNTTDAEVEQELTRSVGLAMVLKALGYAQADADAKAADNKFVDMDDAAWAKGYAALAEELKISNGTSVEPKLFSPMQKLDQKSFVTFMLRALGYDADKAWAEAGALAKEAGLVAGELAEGAFKKGDAAVVMYNALLAKVQGDEKGRTLAEKLVDEKKLDKDLAVANGLMSAEPEKLMVAEVKADNLKEVVVMFNGTADKATAEKSGNYKVKGQTVKEAKLQEDGKTVVLTLEKALTNRKETTLTVSKVKNVAGVEIEKQEVKFTPNDVEYPTVKEVVFTGPKDFEITFSEPINFEKSKDAKVVLKDGNAILSTKLSENENNRVLNVTVNSTLKDGKEYTVIVGDAKNSKYVVDFAGYPNLYYELPVTYTADKTAPEMTVVKSNQSMVVVEFNKPVRGLTKAHFYHSFSSYTALAVYKDADMKPENEIKPADVNKAFSKVWVKFYDVKTKAGHALPAGTVPFTVLNKVGGTKIQDNWKNEFPTTTVNLDIVADREAPEVVAVEVTGEKNVKVSFNEDIDAKDATVVLLDKDGKEVEKTPRISLEVDKKDLKVTFNKKYAGKTMTLVVKGVKDMSPYGNIMNEYTTTLDFTDKTWEGVEGDAKFRKVGDKFYIYLTYKEDMDESALEKGNYKFKVGNDKPADVKGDLEFAEGRLKVVKFELNKDDKELLLEGDPLALKAGVKILINQKVKDVAGNVSEGFETVVSVDSATTQSPAIKEAKAVATDRIEVELKVTAISLNTDNFTIVDAVDESVLYPNNTLTFDVKDDKNVIIYLPSDKKLGTDAKKDNKNLKVKFTENNGTLDIYGMPLAGNAVDVQDKIKPAIAAFVATTSAAQISGTDAFNSGYVTANSDFADEAMVIVKKTGLASPKAYKVEIKYTEDLKDTSISTTTYTVSNDFKVESVAVLNNIVTLNLEKKDADDIDASTLTVTQVGSVRDNSIAENTMEGNSAAMRAIKGW